MSTPSSASAAVRLADYPLVQQFVSNHLMPEYHRQYGLVTETLPGLIAARRREIAAARVLAAFRKERQAFCDAIEQADRAGTLTQLVSDFYDAYNDALEQETASAILICVSGSRTLLTDAALVDQGRAFCGQEDR